MPICLQTLPIFLFGLISGFFTSLEITNLYFFGCGIEPLGPFLNSYTSRIFSFIADGIKALLECSLIPTLSDSKVDEELKKKKDSYNDATAIERR